MMVTIESMCRGERSARFPISRARSFRVRGRPMASSTPDYFGQALTSSALLDWLTPVAPLVDVH